MPKYEVTTDLIIHTKVKVIVEADDKDAAISAAADILPANYAPERAADWKATVKLKPPSYAEVISCRAYHFEQASGSDKAKRIAE